jgi:hypothetical protein
MRDPGSSTPAARRRPFERAAPVTLVASVVYVAMVGLTTQVESVRAVSQWQNDPPDAIASLGVQVVAVVGAVTFARWLRYRREAPVPSRATTYLSRGCWTLLAIMWANVVADAIAQIGQAAGRFTGGLAVVPPLALAATALALVPATAVAARQQVAASRWNEPIPSEPEDAPDQSDALADLAVVARRWIGRIRRSWPALAAVADSMWALGLDIGRRVPSLNLRRHPWRCCVAVAVLAGTALATSHALAEGPGLGDAVEPAVAVGAILVAIEGAAVLAAFAALRSWLGLVRPST